MSGQLKEVRERIGSVKSTQQITKAMKMVSAAKLKRATDAIVQMRPYSEKLSVILGNILGASASDEMEMKLADQRGDEKVLVVVFTSDRGLCGAFNTNIIKKAKALIAEQYANSDVTVMAMGKKAAQAFAKTDYKLIDKHAPLITDFDFESVSKVAQEVMTAFEEKQYDKVELVYSQFRNPAVQFFISEQFLPVMPAEAPEDEKSATSVDFIFEPDRTSIVKTLVPKILKTQFFKAMLDTNASQHGARMTAMDNATENAEELLKDLKISYNRARQAAITTELTEIVSGAA
ncbi:MAG: ATP synthase F1 subunit gamma, partial [Chitinophagales bacterium]